MIIKGNMVQLVEINDETTNLSLKKIYRVIESIYGNWIVLQNDIGEQHVYPSRYFTVDTAYQLPPGVTSKKLDGKPHLAYIDPNLLYEMGLGMRQGAIKHGWNNHRTLTKEAAQEILDSTLRHLNSYLRGEQIDPELQINHLACVVNNINFLYRLDRRFGFQEVLDIIYGETR